MRYLELEQPVAGSSSSNSSPSSSFRPPPTIVRLQDRKGKDKQVEPLLDRFGSVERRRGGRNEGRDKRIESMQTPHSRVAGDQQAEAVHSTLRSTINNSTSGALPSLLDHLSLSGSSTFSTSMPSTSSATFTFESPLPSSASSPLEPSSPPKRNLYDSESPSRLKKRKVLHNFYRSPSLLSGPTALSTFSTSPSLFETPRSIPRTSSSSTTPNWWASISRCDGEQKQSRFAPSEEEWMIGNDSEWSKSSTLALSSTTAAPEAVERPNVTLTRSESAPAVLESNSSGGRGQGGGGVEAEEPISGPALKKLLLLNLRQKWSNEGVPTSAGEAALRFKKWVMWNAWRLETQGTESDYSGEYALGEGENDSEMDWIDPDDEMDDNELFEEADGQDENNSNTLTVVPHEYFSELSSGKDSSYGGGCVFSLTGQMIDLSLPTPPSSPSRSKTSPSSSTEQYTYLSAAIPNTQPSTAPSSSPSRPGLRRSSTVPANLPSTSSQSHVQVSIAQAPSSSTSSSSTQITAPSPLLPITSPILLCEG
ncbi:hypothetical protein JCM3765_007825 [Sporobolomyces pararoseus]